MKELKFICPSCGQHIQCDWKHAGENVPCPGCATLIRVPREGDVTDAPSPPSEDNPFAVAAGDGEKVSYASTKAADGPEPKKSPAAAERAVATPVAPVTANSALTPSQEPPAMVPAAHTSELHCVCPVCQSALQISVKPESSPGAAPRAAGPVPPGAEPLPLAERERQIAVARERALHSATAKPRLDRILGD